MLKKGLRYKHYKLYAINPTDRPKRCAFSTDTVHEMYNNERFLQKIVFSDEATFHVCGHIYPQNARMCLLKILAHALSTKITDLN